jgi:diphthamide synthase (EF-2-diphthine--ammonia ligase)
VSNCAAAAAGQVAAIGLDPHKHLGKSIRQMQPLLRSLRDRFGCNVCGEGGEYETLTLHCPAFKHGRIVLDEWEVRTVKCCYCIIRALARHSACLCLLFFQNRYSKVMAALCWMNGR